MLGEEEQKYRVPRWKNISHVLTKLQFSVINITTSVAEI
jgi:hypothetical protein